MGILGVSDKLKEWTLENLSDTIKAEGELVTHEQAQARIAICNGCEYLGEVQPLPKIKTSGCTKCGCPLVTKAYMKTLLRRLENAGEELSIQEIIEMKTLKKFDRKSYFSEKVVCPHPQGNKWEAADSLFQS